MAAYARLARMITLVFQVAAIAGCAQIDNVNDRTRTMNLAISEAENKSILLNLARASLAEPLSFSALSSYTGHQTLTSTLTAPNIGLKGTNLLLDSLQTAGNMGVGSLSNDFTYAGYDDNATYAALLQPLSPATLGYFLQQEYPRELIFVLTVAKIRVIESKEKAVEYRNTGITVEELERYKPGTDPFSRFLTELQSLIDSGLTAQVDVLTGSRAKLCFDPTIEKIYQVDGREETGIHPGAYGPNCDVAVPVAVTPIGAKDKEDKESSGKNDKATPAKSPAFKGVYSFTEPGTGHQVEIYFRSAFGIYRYLGELISNDIVLGILRDRRERDHRVITVDGEQDCFVEDVYRNRHFCVPNSATTSKRVFSFLHDLVKLYTFTTAAPQTITARLIPGGG